MFKYKAYGFVTVIFVILTSAFIYELIPPFNGVPLIADLVALILLIISLVLFFYAKKVGKEVLKSFSIGLLIAYSLFALIFIGFVLLIIISGGPSFSSFFS